MDTIKIMLVDDHKLIREGIKQLLEIDKNLQVIEEAGDGIECLQKLKSVKPDILLLDIEMPNMNGIQVLEKLKNKEISIKILILTFHNELEYLFKAVEMGVNGYLLKSSDSIELKKAIYDIVNDHNYIQPILKPILNQKIRKLTKREFEILSQIAHGMSNKEIAINFDISERTVKNHISNIFKKINVSDRTQAAIFAIKNEIVRLH